MKTIKRLWYKLFPRKWKPHYNKYIIGTDPYKKENKSSVGIMFHSVEEIKKIVDPNNKN